MKGKPLHSAFKCEEYKAALKPTCSYFQFHFFICGVRDGTQDAKSLLHRCSTQPHLQPRSWLSEELLSRPGFINSSSGARHGSLQGNQLKCQLKNSVPPTQEQTKTCLMKLFCPVFCNAED